MKTKLMIAAALLFGLCFFNSCGPSYDKKKCEKIVEKIDEDDLKAADYMEMIDQADGLLAYLDKQVEEISELDSKDKRCDKFDTLNDSDEADYAVKICNALAYAKENDELKDKAREVYSEKEIKSRYKSFTKRIYKALSKCD